jgi:hypothetical protein
MMLMVLMYPPRPAPVQVSIVPPPPQAAEVAASRKVLRPSPHAPVAGALEDEKMHISFRHTYKTPGMLRDRQGRLISPDNLSRPEWTGYHEVPRSVTR